MYRLLFFICTRIADIFAIRYNAKATIYIIRLFLCAHRIQKSIRERQNQVDFCFVWCYIVFNQMNIPFESFRKVAYEACRRSCTLRRKRTKTRGNSGEPCYGQVPKVQGAKPRISQAKGQSQQTFLVLLFAVHFWVHAYSYICICFSVVTPELTFCRLFFRL